MKPEFLSATSAFPFRVLKICAIALYWVIVMPMVNVCAGPEPGATFTVTVELPTGVTKPEVPPQPARPMAAAPVSSASSNMLSYR